MAGLPWLVRLLAGAPAPAQAQPFQGASGELPTPHSTPPVLSSS